MKTQIKKPLAILAVIAVLLTSAMTGFLSPVPAEAMTSRQWNADITDAKLSAMDGEMMSCDEYFRWAMGQVYGLDASNAYTVAGVENWLKSNATYMGESNSLIKPGDVIIFVSNSGSREHVAIAGGEWFDSAKGAGYILHHGGVGSSNGDGTDGTVVYKNDYESKNSWTTIESKFTALSWIARNKEGSQGSGAGDSFRVYRLIQDTGYFKLKKSASGDTSLVSQCPGSYSLAGAVYGVYKDSGCKSRVTTLTTDANGDTPNSVALTPGKYWVKEITPPDGFYQSDTVYEVNVGPGFSGTVQVTDEPKADPRGTTVRKAGENGEPLSGGVYKIWHVDLNGNVTRTWYFMTDENGAINYAEFDKYVVNNDEFQSDEPFVNGNGEYVLPPGKTYTQEVKAPEGYDLEDTIYMGNHDGITKVPTVNITEYELPTIGTLAFFGTDENGEKVKAEKAKDGMQVTDTVAYENCQPGKAYTAKGELVDKATGDIIAIAETAFVPTEKNGTVDVVFDFEVTEWAEEGKDLYVAEYLYRTDRAIDADVPVAEHDDPDSEEQSVKVEPVKPELKTFALFADTKTQSHAGEDNLAVVDKVLYTDLLVGHEHRVVGQLIDKATGKVLSEGEVFFTPDEASGELEVEFTIDAKKYAENGGKFYITETLYREDKPNPEEPIHVHDGETDMNQNLTVPSVKTTVMGQAGRNGVYASEKTELVDTITYTGLVAGNEYTAEGVLMDKATGKPILDDHGKEIKASVSFIPEKQDGTVEVKFVFDATKLKGKTIVVFEDVKEDGVLVATHADINDAAQTIKVVDVPVPATGDNGMAGLYASLLALAGGMLVVSIKKSKQGN